MRVSALPFGFASTVALPRDAIDRTNMDGSAADRGCEAAARSRDEVERRAAIAGNFGGSWNWPVDSLFPNRRLEVRDVE